MKKKIKQQSDISTLGYGVYKYPTEGVTKYCVLKTLKTGYRQINTSYIYI